MGTDGQADVGCVRSHLDGDCGFADEVADVRNLISTMTYRIQRRSRRSSSSTYTRCRANRAANAPSITRWSNDRDSGSMLRGTNSVPFHTGDIFERTTPRIATSGAFTIGVKPVPPIPPGWRW